MSNAIVLASSELAAKLRAGRSDGKTDNFGRVLAAVAKQMANELSGRWKTRVNAAYQSESGSIARAPAGATALVAWRGPDAKTPLMRIATSHATVDALVEIMCGGSPGLIRKGAARAPGFVERQAFAALARDIAATIAYLAAPEGPVDHVAVDQETAENAESMRPPGMAGGWIELRAEGVALRIHVSATTSAFGTAEGLPAQSDDRGRWAARVKANISRMETRVVAVIEERTISLAEIVACEVGSMLALTASPQSMVKLMADDAPLFDCQLGQAGGYYTVRIAGEEKPAEVD